MSRSRTVKTVLPLLIGVGLLVSACAAQPGDPGYNYASLDYDYDGGWHHGWRGGHGDHGGFVDHNGGGDHDGGGHGGGGGGHGR